MGCGINPLKKVKVKKSQVKKALKEMEILLIERVRFFFDEFLHMCLTVPF